MVWIVLAGFWLAIGHLVAGALLCLTIIGIPLGVASFTMIPISLTPLGHLDLDLTHRGSGLGADAQAA